MNIRKLINKHNNIINFNQDFFSKINSNSDFSKYIILTIFKQLNITKKEDSITENKI